MTSPPWQRCSHGGWRSTSPSASAARTSGSTTRASPPLPALIVIDGGRGQLSAGLKELGPFRDLGVTVVSLAKRIEEVFTPGAARRCGSPTTRPSCSCSSARATRRTASRSSSTAAGATRR